MAPFKEPKNGYAPPLDQTTPLEDVGLFERLRYRAEDAPAAPNTRHSFLRPERCLTEMHIIVCMSWT